MPIPCLGIVDDSRMSLYFSTLRMYRDLDMASMRFPPFPLKQAFLGRKWLTNRTNKKRIRGDAETIQGWETKRSLPANTKLIQRNKVGNIADTMGEADNLIQRPSETLEAAKEFNQKKPHRKNETLFPAKLTCHPHDTNLASWLAASWNCCWIRFFKKHLMVGWYI